MSFEDHDLIAPLTKELYQCGLQRGSLTGWPSVDRLYTVGLSQWTLVSGFPGSGKSEWVDALMVNLAKRGEWKFAIYSPENHPLQLHYAKIIEKYVGKPFSYGPTPRLDPEELEDALNWMRGKFFFAKPDKPNIFAILEEASKAVSFGSWKLGVVIDPWNHLEHHRNIGMSETEYVSCVLSEVIRWVREMNCHLWLVAHPSKLQKDRDGKLPIPTPHDISGSAHFWNKADNCVTVWRDQKEQSQSVEIHVQKIRFKHIGHIGAAELLYDRVTGRYYEPLRSVQQQSMPYAD